jgi:predicted kinase
MLYIFGGLPGTGKTTLATALARRCGACYLRIDTIEQAMRDSGLVVDGPPGYVVGYRLALDNLRLGVSVVADSVNPLTITRQAWVDVALQASSPYVEIEVICSDRAEHHERITARQTDIAGLRLPTWNEVMERHYEEWNTKHILLDTARQSPEQSTASLIAMLGK